MNLHSEPKLFSNTLRAASDHLRIRQEFVEKDYWITLVLHRLAVSPYANDTVFKGGTSLSKAYNLIDRFSEDVDLAVIVNPDYTGNQIKTRLKGVFDSITGELAERPEEGITSKGSQFRRSLFEYNSVEKGTKNNQIIVEVNSFANPFPNQQVLIRSMVYDFLNERGSRDIIQQFGLESFYLNVLSKRQTLLEKLVALIRFSFDEHVITSLSGKIRHFYDLYYLMHDSDCKEYVNSKEFRQHVLELLQHDQEIFDDPKGWKTKAMEESPLLLRFPVLWSDLKGKYTSELGMLAYSAIPGEQEIADTFAHFIKVVL